MVMTFHRRQRKPNCSKKN